MFVGCVITLICKCVAQKKIRRQMTTKKGVGEERRRGNKHSKKYPINI